MKSMIWREKLSCALLLVVVVLSSIACSKRQVLLVEIPISNCLQTPPPKASAITFKACVGFEACLSFEDAGKLLKYLRSMGTWSRQAYLSCGEKNENEKQ